MRRTVRTSDGLDLEVVEFGGEGPPILLLHGLMGPHLVAGGALAARARSRGRGGRPRARPLAGRAAVDDRADGPRRRRRAGRRGTGGGRRTLDGWAARAGARGAPAGAGAGAGRRGHGRRLPRPRREQAGAWFAALPQPFPSLAAVRLAFGHPRPEFGEYMAECVGERADGYHLLAAVEHTTAIAARWASTDHWPDLDAVRCPVLLVEAEQPVAPPGRMARMAERLADARHLMLPGTGHLVHAADPHGYRAALTSFLDRIS